MLLKALRLCVAAMVVSACMGWSIPDEEVKALCFFYSRTGGPRWTIRDGWVSHFANVTEDPCTWYGVTCKDGHVNALSLPRNNLEGVIPESLGDLTELVSFDFGVNKLRGTFPFSMQRLRKLYAISVRENSLTGPLDFATLSEMQYAHMDFNRFTGDLSSLKNCTKLAVLGLTDNGISGKILAEFAAMGKLQTLFLGGNSLTGTVPALTSPSLRAVDLSRNSLTGTVPLTALLGISDLVELNLFHNALSGTLAASRPHKSLVVFDAHANSITGEVPSVYAVGMKSMDILHLQDNLLSGTLSPAFSASTVYSTNLTGNRLSCPLPQLPPGFSADCVDGAANAAAAAAAAVTPKAYAADFTDAARMKAKIKAKAKSNGAKPVSVVIHGEAKCPDMGSIEDIFADITATLGEDVVEVSLGWIAKQNDEYPTGYWSLHGQTEVIGNAYTSCAAHAYGITKALAFTKCLNVNISVIPTNTRECAARTGLDFDALRACALGEKGAALLKEAVALSDSYGAVWSPTVYINDELYCLWHSAPCKATKESDFGKAVCDAYTGPRPSACSKYDI